MSKYQLLYDIYERRLGAQIDRQRLPHHVAIILDGNRRWAKAEDSPAAAGHQKGADKIFEVLRWCAQMGVEVVTLWMLSTDNLKREAEELQALEQIICKFARDLKALGAYHIRVIGNRDVLSEPLREVLGEVDTSGSEKLMQVNLAVGYGGRQEIIDAVKGLLRERAKQGVSLEEVADNLNFDDITSHLYTKGQPDPDLVIRTSGEQRLSGFLLWQSAHSEFYFCETYWPDFRRVDFLRALRDYSRRERRMGR